MITSPAPHVLDTIMIMWMWRGGRGLGGWRRGRGGKSLTLGQTRKADISLRPALKRLPTPSFLYFLFRFSSGRYSCQTLIWERKSSQDEVVNVFVSSLAGHGCQLASGEPGTPLDQVVRSPFSYSAYFFTLSCYFIKLLPYPISRHIVTFVNLPSALSVP